MHHSLVSKSCLRGLSRSEPLSVRCFFAPTYCRRAAPWFRSLARAPIARSETWPLRCSTVPSLRNLARVLLRGSFAPGPCPCAVPSLRTLVCAPAPSSSIDARLLSLAIAVPLSLSLSLAVPLPCSHSPCRYLAISRRASLLSRRLVSVR